jgi:hypothetical protein
MGNHLHSVVTTRRTILAECELLPASYWFLAAIVFGTENGDMFLRNVGRLSAVYKML